MMTPDERNRINERLARFMGWRIVDVSKIYPGEKVWVDPLGDQHPFHPCVLPDFTADLVAVMEVARALAPEWEFRISLWKDKSVSVRFHNVQMGGYQFVVGAEPDETIARACYEAIGPQEGEK